VAAQYRARESKHRPRRRRVSFLRPSGERRRRRGRGRRGSVGERETGRGGEVEKRRREKGGSEGRENREELQNGGPPCWTLHYPGFISTILMYNTP
jgi:hypothetical protein